MALINNGEILGKYNKDLILETAGRLYIKVRDRLYEIDYKKLNDIDSLVGRAVEQSKLEESENKSESETIQQEINLDDYITSDDLRRKLKNYVTTRSWEDVTKTQKALENALLNGYTESISPITVNTMQISVGSEQLQFEWVKSFIDSTIAESPLKIEDDGDISYTPGYIKHYTLDGPSSVTPDNTSRSANNYWRWQILNETGTEDKMKLLLENDEAYYCYLVVPYKSVLGIQESNPDAQGDGLNGANISLAYNETNGTFNSGDPTLFYAEKESPADTKNGPGLYTKTGTGYFYYTQDAHEYHNENDEWYYMLYAIITNGVTCPSISTMNGFTEITPGQVRAYLFASPDGTSFLDLQNDKFKLGEKLMYGDGKLLLDGVLVQRDGTGEQPITIFRGEWSSVNTYTQNDVVTYTKDGNIASYICKSKVTSDVTPDQDSEHWSVYATGTKGDKGDDGAQGAISRFRKWNKIDRYYDGKTISLEPEDLGKEVYYLDYVSYENGDSWTYWKCIGFNSDSQNINIAPGSDSNIWIQISSFETLSTGTMLIGTDQGWYIDGGVIRHSSGKMELRGDGTIMAGDVTLDSEGNPVLGTGGGFYVTKQGVIGANKGILGKWTIDNSGICYNTSSNANFANLYPNSFWIKFQDSILDESNPTCSSEFKVNSGTYKPWNVGKIINTISVNSKYTGTLSDSYANVLNYEMPNCYGFYINTEGYTSNYNFALYCDNGTIAGFKPAPYYITKNNQLIHGELAENNNTLLEDYSYYWVNNTEEIPQSYPLKLPANPRHGQYIKLIHMNKNKEVYIYPNTNQTIYSVRDEKTIAYVYTNSRISLEFQYFDYLYMPNGSGYIVKTPLKQWFLYKYAQSDT